MKKANKTLVLAIGTTLIAGLTSVAVGAEMTGVQGGTFEMTELSSGYMQLAVADAAPAGTATKPADAKAKAPEGKCAGAKPVTAAPKAQEGKCGEGKCGEAMKKAAADAAKTTAEPAKNAAESAKTATTATPKAAEGKCGESMKKMMEEAPKPADASAVKK